MKKLTGTFLASISLLHESVLADYEDYQYEDLERNDEEWTRCLDWIELFEDRECK